jgi:tRNA-Thr(GGU) m(6)t(6)A37 methyltransferase TsaA
MAWNFEPIGWIRQCSYKEKFGTPRQGALIPESRAFIELSPQLPAGSLEGLEGFSHLWLIWLFHANTNKKIKGKVQAPRLEGARMGLFATRSPHRPNPLGLTLVKREERTEKGFWISGVDLIEGTPLLDIKPYIPEDRAEAPRFGWSTDTRRPERPTRWSLKAEEELQLLPEEKRAEFKRLVNSTLAEDPRPVIYRKLENEQAYAGPYGLRLEDYNLKFTSGPEGFEIISLEIAGV